MTKPSIAVFVYGTLKGMNRGGRWGAKGDIQYVGRGFTESRNFKMHGGSFPVVNRAHSDDPNIGQVQGEVYLVDDKVLARLDSYEGAPSFYEAEPTIVHLEGSGVVMPALIYLGRSVNNTLSSRPIIKPSSDVDPVLYWRYPSEYKPEAL